MPKKLYSYDKDNDYINFYDDGTIVASTQSYEINGYGEITVDKKGMIEFFEAMKKYLYNES